MLQHLMREYSIEGFVAKPRRVDVADLEGEAAVGKAAGEWCSRIDDARRGIDAYGFAGRHTLGQAGGDRPWPAPDVEQPHTRLEEWQKKCCVDFRRTLGMVGHHRWVMAVLVSPVAGSKARHLDTSESGGQQEVHGRNGRERSAPDTEARPASGTARVDVLGDVGSILSHT